MQYSPCPVIKKYVTDLVRAQCLIECKSHFPLPVGLDFLFAYYPEFDPREKGITQVQLAELLGVSRETITRTLKDLDDNK